MSEENKTVPNQQLIDLGAPTIKLGGQSWPIPHLSPKQMRVLLPLLLALIPKISNSYSEVEVDGGGTKSVADMSKLAVTFKDGGLDNIYTIIFLALTKGHPKLTKEEFDSEFTIGTFEMIDALLVIGLQTGAMRTVRKGEAVPMGEAAAASQ